MAKVERRGRDQNFDLKLVHKHRAHEGICPERVFFFSFSLRLESLQIDTMALNGTLSIELGEPPTFFMLLLLLLFNAKIKFNQNIHLIQIER